jgi:hypothetical protein
MSLHDATAHAAPIAQVDRYAVSALSKTQRECLIACAAAGELAPLHRGWSSGTRIFQAATVSGLERIGLMRLAGESRAKRRVKLTDKGAERAAVALAIGSEDLERLTAEKEAAAAALAKVAALEADNALPYSPSEFARFLRERAAGHSPEMDIEVHAKPGCWLALADLIDATDGIAHLQAQADKTLAKEEWDIVSPAPAATVESGLSEKERRRIQGSENTFFARILRVVESNEVPGMEPWNHGNAADLMRRMKAAYDAAPAATGYRSGGSIWSAANVKTPVVRSIPPPKSGEDK